MFQVKKRDDLIHKENKLEVGGIAVHPSHMAAMQGEDKNARKVNLNIFLAVAGFSLAPMGQLGHHMMHHPHPMSHL